jgi:hypothetical protein
MDGGNRRRGRDWPDLVVRRDVQLGPRGRLGNEFGRNIAACSRFTAGCLGFFVTQRRERPER